MNDKLGRNDPCHCGSGKKYKKCCIDQDESNIVVADFELQRLRRTEGEVINEHLFPYIEEVLTKDIEEYVWSIFSEDCDWPEEDIDRLYDQMFIPWFLFNWVDDPLDYDIKTDLVEDKTIAENYLIANRDKLSRYQLSFMEAMNKTYYSFYIVKNVIPDKQLILKDIFLDTIHTVKEKTGTHYIKKGNIVFTRLVTLDDQTISVGTGPYIVSSTSHARLLERKKLWEDAIGDKLTPELLRKEYDCDLLDEYFMIIDQSFAMPVMRNSDGEDIIFHKLHYNLSISANEAFEKLLLLTDIEAKEHLLSEAEKDAYGNIISIEFPWLKTKESKSSKLIGSTVLGHITIKEGKLIAEVNSEERKNTLEILLNDYLGEVIDTPKISIESMEQKLNSARDSDNVKSISNDNLEDLPEVQDYMKDLADKHWEEWFDEEIPALGNKTPRQAAKTEEGRELLESLLLYYEQGSKDKENERVNIFQPNIPYLRSKLGMS